MSRRFSFYLGSLLVVLGVSYHGQAHALSDAEAERILAILHPDAKSLAELQKQFPAFGKQQKKIASTGSQAGSENAAGPSRNAMAAAPPAPPATAPPPSPVSFMLRNDWSDLGVLGACLGGGVATGKAKGGSVSFTQDNVAANRIWAAQAMGAAVYSDCNLNLTPLPGGGDSGFFERTIAIYAQVNSSYNSNASLTSKNLDTRTAGIAGGIAYLHSGDYEIFRLIPNVVQDAIKGNTSVAAMLQYIPFWVSHAGIWHNTFTPNGYVTYQFDPTFDLQFANTTDPKKPLSYSGKDQSLRIGPELTFLVAPFAGSNSLLSRIGLTETYHPWYEAYSRTSSYWWANAITYNLTENGNFALGFSYNKGLDENSGAMTNQYIVSLNGKI
jgi:hypothetical protein